MYCTLDRARLYRISKLLGSDQLCYENSLEYSELTINSLVVPSLVSNKLMPCIQSSSHPTFHVIYFYMDMNMERKISRVMLYFASVDQGLHRNKNSFNFPVLRYSFTSNVFLIKLKSMVRQCTCQCYKDRFML
jgi:hypothetical protein